MLYYHSVIVRFSPGVGPRQQTDRLSFDYQFVPPPHTAAKESGAALTVVCQRLLYSLRVRARDLSEWSLWQLEHRGF
jgi:hypothetical protein